MTSVRASLKTQIHTKDTAQAWFELTEDPPSTGSFDLILESKDNANAQLIGGRIPALRNGKKVGDASQLHGASDSWWVQRA